MAGFELKAVSTKGEEVLNFIYSKKLNGAERQAMSMFRVNTDPIILRFLFGDKIKKHPNYKYMANKNVMHVQIKEMLKDYECTDKDIEYLVVEHGQ